MGPADSARGDKVPSVHEGGAHRLLAIFPFMSKNGGPKASYIQLGSRTTIIVAEVKHGAQEEDLE